MNPETLGIENARLLSHGAQLKGVQSGTIYIVRYYENESRPWVLQNFHTYENWGTWTTREQMIKELSGVHMAPIRMW